MAKRDYLQRLREIADTISSAQEELTPEQDYALGVLVVEERHAADLRRRAKCRAAARKAGAVHIQTSDHGCGRKSLQGFDASGKCVYDIDL